MIDNKMTCAECDELLLDYFEDTLHGTSLTRFNEHTSTCMACQALIRDVNGIRDEAAGLPHLAPSRDLWSEIDARIQPEVHSITARTNTTTSRRWLAAAAAALIIATSGVTYLATSRSVTRQPGTASAAPMTIVAPPKVAVVPVPSVTPNAEPGAVAAAPTAVETPAVPQTRAVSIVVTPAPGTSLASSAPPTASELAFSGDIKQLQSVLAERRGQLEPETVKVVEDNLKLIDTAVQRARSALLKDPASGFLTRQLDNALKKKIELLRTAALLPSST